MPLESNPVNIYIKDETKKEPRSAAEIIHDSTVQLLGRKETPEEREARIKQLSFWVR